MIVEKKELELIEIFDCGFDRKKRRIYFGTEDVQEDEGHGDVGWKSVENAVKALHILEKDNSKRPIEIHTYSWGGDVYGMQRFMDELEYCDCKTIFIGGGRIASAMTWIMSVCDERRLYKNTTVMLHDGSDGVSGKHTDVQIDARHGKFIQDMLNKSFARNSVMPVEFWENMLQRDVYLTPEETVMLGLADKVIQPKKRGNLRRSRIALMNQPRDPKEMKKLVKSMYERTNREKAGLKIELSVPQEECDPAVTVDLSDPVPEASSSDLSSSSVSQPEKPQQSMEPLRKNDQSQEE